MKNLSVDKVDQFAKTKNIFFNEDELNFTYSFIKKNWQTIFASHGIFDINRYKDKYQPENFNKLIMVYKEYLQKNRFNY